MGLLCLCIKVWKQQETKTKTKASKTNKLLKAKEGQQTELLTELHTLIPKRNTFNNQPEFSCK